MMNLIDIILEKAAKKSDSAEVYHTTVESVSCEWGSDKLKLAEGRETSGVALRVIIDGRLGCFASSKTDDPDMIVDSACELAPLGSEFAAELPSEFKPADADFYHEPTAVAGPDRLVEAGNSMIGKVKAARSEARFETKLERDVFHATIANTRGARSDFRKAFFSGYVRGSITREGDVLGLWDYGSFPRLENQPDEWADGLIRKFKDAETIVDLPPGKYPCIMTPMSLEIIGPLRSGLNARMVLKDMSPLKDKVGEKIFDDRINIIDDGLNPETVGSQPIDDEGITAQVTPLVESGVLKGFIHDLHTASRMGVEPTGNGMKAGLSAAPRAGFTTLTFSPGSKSLDEMIAGIDKGVLIDQIMGAHQASPFSGEFSVSISLGFVIENGKIIGRFKDGMLAGNIFNMLKDQLVEIGSELRIKQSDVLIPHLLFDNMTVAT